MSGLLGAHFPATLEAGTTHLEIQVSTDAFNATADAAATFTPLTVAGVLQRFTVVSGTAKCDHLSQMIRAKRVRLRAVDTAGSAKAQTGGPITIYPETVRL